MASVSLPPEPGPEKKPGAKSPLKTFSIPKPSALKEQINQPQVEVVEEEEDPNAPVKNGRTKPFTEEDIRSAWQSNLERLEAVGKHQELIFLKEDYEVKGGDITLFIANEALEARFEKAKSEVLLALRGLLSNDSITLRSRLVDIDKSKMLYTDQEKFEHLKQKYPALKDLQDQLGLDPEF